MNENNLLRAPQRAWGGDWRGGGPSSRSVMGGGIKYPNSTHKAPCGNVRISLPLPLKRLVSTLILFIFFYQGPARDRIKTYEPPQRGAWAVVEKARLGRSLVCVCFV